MSDNKEKTQILETEEIVLKAVQGRINQGLLQEELAEKAGLDITEIMSFETLNLAYQQDIITTIKIYNALGLSLNAEPKQYDVA